jgi:hypothetical protein
MTINYMRDTVYIVSNLRFVVSKHTSLVIYCFKVSNLF